MFRPGRPLVGDRQVAVPVTATFVVRATGKRCPEHEEMHLWTFGPDGKGVAFRHLVDTHLHWLALQP